MESRSQLGLMFCFLFVWALVFMGLQGDARAEDYYCVFQKTSCTPLCGFALNSWLTVAKCTDPVQATGAPCGLQLIPENQPGMSFQAASALRDYVALTSNRYDTFCCKQYRLWISADRQRWACTSDQSTPGPGWFFERGMLCYEECVAAVGGPVRVSLMSGSGEVELRDGKWRPVGGSAITILVPNMPPLTLSASSAPGTPQDSSGQGFAVFLLTNISNGTIWVGKESELRAKKTWNFRGGGLAPEKGGADIPVQYQKKSQDFNTYDEAVASYCRSLQSPPREIPMTGGGKKAVVYGAEYWVDTAPSCSPVKSSTQTTRTVKIGYHNYQRIPGVSVTINGVTKSCSSGFDDSRPFVQGQGDCTFEVPSGPCSVSVHSPGYKTESFQRMCDKDETFITTLSKAQ